jgi:hypothetical protein
MPSSLTKGRASGTSAKNASARRSTTSIKPQDGLTPVGEGPALRLFVADQFRTEQGGKVLAIGLYTDNVVVFPSDAPEPTSDLPLGLELSLLINISGVQGKGTVSIQLGREKREMALELKRQGSANFVLNLQPLLIEAFGKKTVQVGLAGQVHELHFEARKGSLDPEAG